jgi:DNA-binding NarL/FixJ family response regulator
LEAAGFAVAQVDVSDDVPNVLQAHRSEVVLLDIDMPGNRDLELLQTLSQQAPLVPVVILTGRPTLETALRAVRLGVVDYIRKPPKVEELIERIDLATHRGRVLRSIEAAEAFASELRRRLDALKQAIYQGPVAATRSAEHAGSEPDPLSRLSADELRRLSPREREVLRELAKGHSPQEMAKGFALSTNTVRNHLKSIFLKLGVKSQVALLGRLASPRR